MESQGVKFVISEPAYIPTSPVKPNVFKTVFLGLILGGAIGIGLAYSAEYFDHSFRSLEDAADFLTKPILGAIPAIVSKEEMRKKRKWEIQLWIVGTLVFLLLTVLILVVLSNLAG